MNGPHTCRLRLSGAFEVCSPASLWSRVVRVLLAPGSVFLNCSTFQSSISTGRSDRCLGTDWWYAAVHSEPLGGAVVPGRESQRDHNEENQGSGHCPGRDETASTDPGAAGPDPASSERTAGAFQDPPATGDQHHPALQAGESGEEYRRSPSEAGLIICTRRRTERLGHTLNAQTDLASIDIWEFLDPKQQKCICSSSLIRSLALQCQELQFVNSVQWV